MQALQDTYDDDGKLISGVLYDDDGNLISSNEPKIGDEVGVPEKLKEFDTQPFKANLSFFEPKKPQVQPDIKPPSGDPSLDLSEEDKKLAQQTVPYKGGIVSALWLKNHPDGIYGIGRNDERLTNVPDLIQEGTQKLIDKSNVSNVIPDMLKPEIARYLTVLGYSVETVANILNDPTAPVMGVIGSLKKALSNAALTQAAKDKLIADAAKEISITLEVQPQKVGTPPYNTSQFGLHPSNETLPYPLNVVPNRVRPPSTNATVFDALLPERLKYNEQGAAQRLTTEVVPPVVTQPERLRTPITFNGRTLEEINELPSGNPGGTGGLRLEERIPIQPGTYGSHHIVEEASPGIVSSIVSEERLPQTGMFGQRAVEPNQGIISRFFEDDSSGVGSAGRPKRGYKIDVNTLNNPIAKIIVKLRQARPLTKEQAEIYRLERGRRAGNVENSAGFGQEWARNVKGALKGEYEKVRFDPLKLEDYEIDSLFEDIKNSDLNSFEKPRAIFAIEKIMRGVVPQKNEIRTLSSVFTKKLTRDLGDIDAARDVTAQLVDSLYKKKPFIHRAAGGAQDFQRTIMSSTDMSAPFRQGGTGILNKEWWTSWDDMFKAWGSEKAAQAIDDSIRSKPNFKLMQDSGLSLTDVTHGNLPEEGFGSAWAEKHIPFVKRSERAYSAFLNKFRSDLFDKMLEDARKNPIQWISGKTQKMSEEVSAQYIAEIINTMTGRANLGKAEKYVDALNQVFYAPRLMGSRIKMLDMVNPLYYIRQPSFVRKQALKSVLSMATLTGTVGVLGKMAGGTVELDPRSADFGKVKFGETRIDPGTGELQYLTAAARLISKSVKTQEGKIRPFGKSPIYDDSTYDILKRFLENKAAPGASLFLKATKEFDPEGNKYNMPVEVAKTYVPMIASDLMEIFQSDPETYMPEMPKDARAIAAAPLTFFGMGSQTYK